MEELHRRERRVFPEGLNALAAAALAALVLTSTFVLRADSSADADLQYQLGTLLFEENRYEEAVDAFDRRYPGALGARAGAVERLAGRGLLERTATHLRLSERATMVGNDVIASLL